MNTFDKVYEVVRKIPKGKVSTYGAVARLARVANPRVVGYALHANTKGSGIPCHRVVNLKGTMAPGFAFGGPSEQKKMLAKEGVQFKGELVDFSASLYSF